MCFPAFSDPPEARNRGGPNAVCPLVSPALVLALTACGSDTEPAVGGAVARTVSTRGPIYDGLSSRGMDAWGAMLMSSGSYRRGFPNEWLPGHMVRFDLDTGVADTVATYDYVPFRPPEGTPENPLSSSYRILSSAGEWLGRLDVPDGLRILDIAGGRILGVMKDEMEVESVAVYELAEAG